MPTQFKLPEVSEGVESVDVGEILVKEGDTIEAGQEVMELETDKAVVPLPCPHAGTVAKILVSSGDSIEIGAPLMEIDESGGGESSEPAEEEQQEEEQQEEEQQEEKPEKKKEEEKPAAEEKSEAEADDASDDHDSGTIEKGTDAPKTAPPKAVAQASKPGGTVETSETPPPPAGPATRRLARELGVDLHQVSGTGPGGRITIEDVQSYVKGQLTSGTASSGGGGYAEPPLPDFSKFGTIEREKMNKLSRTAAKNLGMAWNVIPHVTQHDQFDITDLEEARREFVERAKKTGGPKITMTALAIKASVVTLKEFPKFNASFDSASGEIVYKRFFNIGVAVDTPNGLVVPVITDCDKKSVMQIAAEMTDLAGRARDRKLDISEMQGATFTITNLGGLGGTSFTPIVNWPEVAILGMSRSQKQLGIEDGEISERLMLPLSMSYDHRVINGADAARFVSRLGAILSDPFQWLMES